MIDRTNWVQKDIPAKPKLVSNKILGVGIVLSGGLVLSVALIIGLEFPRHVREKVKEDQCILGTHHHKYEEWTEDEFYTRYNRVYFWTLINQIGFLYHGENPQMEEKGPYIYKETRRKIDVKFSGKTLSYAKMTSQEYQPTMTQTECGQNCAETDRITFINDEFLRLASEFGNDENLLLSLLPKKIRNIINAIVDEYGVDVSSLYTKLGAFESWNTTDTWAFPNFPDISFGSWVSKNDTSYKSKILEFRNGSGFTESEMIGLYAVLTEAVILGVTKKQLDNKNSQNAFASESRCGLLFLMGKVLEDYDGAIQLNYTSKLNDCLCSSKMSPCLDLSDEKDIVKAYIEAFTIFTKSYLLYLPNGVFDENFEIVITKTQRDLTLGFSGSEFVAGILPHHDSIEDALQDLERWVVSTCLEHRDISTNMKTTGFTSTRLNYHSEAVGGFTDYTPVGPVLKACMPCALAETSLPVFLPQLRRAVQFKLTGWGTHKEVNVATFGMTQESFDKGQPGVADTGLQDVSKYTHHLSWMSRPHYYGHDQNVSSVTSHSPSKDLHASTIQIESVTGRVWKSVIRLQYNVGIPSDILTAQRSSPLNIDYLDQHIPLYWTEQSADITWSEVDYYHDKVTRLMRVSCGGLIGISIIAIVVAAIGLVVVFVPLGLGRVAPMPHDIELHST